MRREGAAGARRVDVLVGYRCNSACRFCTQGELRALGELDDAAVRARIEAAAPGRVLVLTGGEPTLRPELPGWVELARRLGWARVEVQTNGRMLAYRRFAEGLREAGVDAVQVALHGPEPAVHDYLTRVPGSFDQAVRGVQRARAAGLAVGLGTVVTRSNFRHLLEVVDLGLTLGMTAWRATATRPEGAARADAGALLPRFELAAPYLERALGRATSRRRAASVKGFPLCVVPGLEAWAVEARPSLRERHVGHEPWRGDGAERAYGAACAPCRLRAKCPGLPAAYAERYGWSETSPQASGLAADGDGEAETRACQV